MDDKNYLPPATITAVRRGLGLTMEEFAHQMGVTLRQVQRWEDGTTRMGLDRTRALTELEDAADEIVEDHVEALSARDSVPPVMALDRGPDAWPIGWQRMIAFRVRQEIPALIIHDRETN